MQGQPTPLETLLSLYFPRTFLKFFFIFTLNSALFIYTELPVPSSIIKSAAQEKLLFFSTLPNNSGSNIRATSMKLKVEQEHAWMGIPDSYWSQCACLSFLKSLGIASRLQRMLGSAKMEQITPSSTLPLNWIFSPRECADRYPPALIIWEFAAGKTEVRSSTLLDRLLKEFHIL